MDIWLDDGIAEKHFRRIIDIVKQYRNGEVADSMKARGIVYHQNWGVSLVDLKTIAGEFEPSHVLALKLWNRQWRETMILATLLDEPEKVTEQQMDFWTKQFPNSEIAEYASAHLWSRTPFAYAKALEWCRGKKHLVHYTAIHLAGRLAITDTASPEEMFDLFFEEFTTLARDPALSTVLYRTLIQMANRSGYLRERTLEWISLIKSEESIQLQALGSEVENGLDYGIA
jgi:hypothetical protein